MLISTIKEKYQLEQKKQTILPEKEGILYLDKYKPGYLVSVDQFVVNIHGRFSNGYIQESSSSIFHGGTLYNDDATGIIWVENQVYLGASKIVLGKEIFEQRLWEKVCDEISHMHSDSIIFASGPFRLDCDNKNQEQYLSEVGTHHQNARS